MIKRYSKWFALLGACLFLLLVLVYNGHKMAQQGNRPMPPKRDAVLAADVVVVRVNTERYTPPIEAFGAAESHYQLTLVSEVEGLVKAVSENLESGRMVKKGELLVQLENSDYRETLATAEAALASARLDLLEVEREADQAQAEWKASGLEGEPDSPLVLYEPQLAEARASVAENEAAVVRARRDLAQTEIRAPFDALIVSRGIAPGSYLQSGGEVAELYSTDRVEIALPLSQRDWNALPDSKTLEQEGWPVALSSVESGAQWLGYVRRVERHQDDTSRQRSLIVAVDQPLAQEPELTPGTFIRAEVPGREQSDLWRLPPSSLSQRGEIWYVTDGLLAKFAAEAVASDKETIYIRPPESLRQQEVSVLVHPLSSYVPGMAVNAVEAGDE
ncbi:efflux RND transporter periplasmic adaptor subunit [Microbulbifer thermotolerans]|uniref:Efflux RND transporter periplasmic adaptor subunit n=1 Tax=Microbulbifer thermotolerans TaxID=252514 RepID=A0A143HKT8_MICTH|nr:efflux RND transporter periplasmic adaptor subunit [Microbulbifer thermotolerans]AMX02303.1 efflux transporter periplasmic adaptor subunit [Microbulbifer thermotolerans]MCX2781741.1 efflux RND transporter periplasmic adaptor subunit [Microbulbifer thermotolerans]MCX2796349.1 efflux RND transporter periplasmic adaptor subunit [Microbulbifer thermotolerans]MCX2803264.1 efflux RND transporter periplasmic adaptor subunit [Microbulbifer thermotolerans]